MKRCSILLCFLCILGIDQAVKAYTVSHIPLMSWTHPLYPYGGVAVFQGWFGIDFSLNYVMNRGAAWGVLADFQQYLLYARFIIVGVLGYYLLAGFVSGIKRLCFCSIFAGAIGNILDFFLYGHVVDLFHFRFWGYFFPVFNVADSAIFLGVFFLLLQSAFLKPKLSTKV